LEGNLRFKLDRASLIVALFYVGFCGQFSKYKPLGGLYLEGRFNGGFFALPVWGAYTWRGLYMEGLIFGILRYVILLCFLAKNLTVITNGQINWICLSCDKKNYVDRGG